MSETARPSMLLPVALAAALLAAGAGAWLYLRPSGEAPAPVPAAPGKPAAPPPVPVAIPAPAPAGTEAVAGRVLRGAEGEEAVADASVEVYAADGGPVPFLAPVAKGTSGADGRFRVAGVAKGVPYRVLAAHEGLASATAVASGGDAPVDIRLLAALPAAGTVVERETKAPIAGARVVADDAVGTTTGPDGSWRLERVRADGGTVTASAPGFASRSRALKESGKGRDAVQIRLSPATTVSGIVIGTDGKPAAGADVTLREFTTFPGAGKMATGSRTAKSGKDGAFLVEEVPLDRALALSAVGEEGFSPSVEAGPLKKGETATGIELRLVPGATLVVTVLDEAGQPVAGARVSHHPEAKPEGGGDEGPGTKILFGASGEPTGQEGTTDAAGVARIRAVHAGKTKVTARKDDFLPAEESVEAVAGAEAALTLRLAPGIAVTGKVLDDLGNPVPGAKVAAMRFRGNESVHESRVSGPDGAFRIGGLEGKGFDLNASKEGFVTANLHRVDPAADPVTLTLLRGGGIAGVAVDEAGKPVVSFSVTTKRTDVKEKPNPMDMMFDLGDSQVHDDAGKFKVEGLAAGTYTVTLKSPGLAPGRAADVAVLPGAVAEVRVVVPAGLEIHGVVVRKGDEAPVAGASVSVAGGGPFGGMDMDVDFAGMGGLGGTGDDEEDSDQAAAAREALAGMFGGGAGAAVSDAEGRFVLKGLEAGTVNLKVKAKDLAPATRKGVPVPSEADVRILVSEGAAIEGTVFDALRAPMPGMTVMLQRMPLTMKMATTDAAGRYRIAGLAPGKYLFYVTEQGAGIMGLGGGMKSDSVTLEEGKTLVKDHRVGEGTKLTGRVTRGGKPVGGTSVILLPGAGRKDAASAMLGGSGFAMATTKEDGAYEIAGIAPGTYTALVQTGFGGTAAPGDAVEIPAGAAEVRRDFAIPRNAIRGVVVDAGGEAVEGAQVHAVVSGKNAMRAADLGEAVASMGGQETTGSDGKFAMDDMNPGTFTILASAAGKGSAVVENVVPSEDGTEVRVVLAAGVEVTVRVLDADGKPVAGAGIYLSDPRGIDLTGLEVFDGERTGSDGKAVLDAPPGTVQFEAVAAGHAPGMTVATAAAGAEVVIHLPRGATIDVLVTDAAGGPRAGAQVRLLDASGSPYAPRMTMEGMGELLSAPSTGTDGRYLRADLPAGTWTVRAIVGERTADATVTLAAGETKSVTVRLP